MNDFTEGNPRFYGGSKDERKERVLRDEGGVGLNPAYGW